MKNTFHKTILFIGIFLTSLGYSKEVQSDKGCSVKCEDPCSSWAVVEDEAPCNCGYNCPARINPACGWDFNIYGDFLYWQAREKDLSPAFRFEVIQTTPTLGQTFETYQNIDFDYHPAFKVGVGMSSERDDWTYNIEYTRYNATNSKKTAISLADFNPDSNAFTDFLNLQGLINALTDQLSIIDNSSRRVRSFDAHWKLNFNIIDFVIGRPCFLGTKLTLSPFYGLKGGWINQHLNVQNFLPLTTLTAPRTDYLINFMGRSKIWLIGPKVGVNSNWLLGAGFRLFGNAAASLNYQHSKARIKDAAPIQNELLEDLETIASQKNSLIIPAFEATIGFGWGSYFNDKRWHFDMTAGYEFQFYYNQNAIIGEFYSSSDSDSLILHGLTLSAKIDF